MTDPTTQTLAGPHTPWCPLDPSHKGFCQFATDPDADEVKAAEELGWAGSWPNAAPGELMEAWGK